MVGVKGRSGGARANSGGAREGAGRPLGAGDVTLSAARLVPLEQKWAFAGKALQYAERMLAILVNIAENGASESARVAAAGKILDRALDKAPAHLDITAMRHTEIVYRSAEQIREEIAARGVPPVLLDYVPPPNENDEDNET